MARYEFGGTVNEWVALPIQWGSHTIPAFGGKGIKVTFWDAEEDGNQYTDLLENGSPVEYVTTRGRVGRWGPILGPDEVDAMWAQAGDSEDRFRVVAVGGKEGPAGPAGTGGSNEDVATYVETEGPTRSALSATFVSRPDAPAEGDVLVYAGGAWTAAKAPHVPIIGTGSPGTLSAPVGSTYIDDAATNGAVRWVMTPSGWVVEYGDTGWQDATMLSPFQGSVRSRVRGGVLYLEGYVRRLSGFSSSFTDAATLVHAAGSESYIQSGALDVTTRAAIVGGATLRIAMSKESSSFIHVGGNAIPLD